MRELRDKVAVVTGAASGIGRALAVRLAEAGCPLALSDVDEAGLADTGKTASERGVRVTTARVDVGDRDAIYRHAEEVVADHGRVNLVVNNAGVALAASLAEVSDDDFGWLMDIDFWGVVHGTRAFLPHLERAGEGHVVNISSVFGLIGVPTNGAYCAAKFAVRGYTETLRSELEIAGSPVSATCVHPGGIRTNIVRNGRLRRSDPGAPSREESEAAFDRLARTSPEDAAEAIVRGVRRNARRVLIGRDAWLLDRMQRWLPTAYQRLLVRMARRGDSVL